jgi:hypothetical protein
VDVDVVVVAKPLEREDEWDRWMEDKSIEIISIFRYEAAIHALFLLLVEFREGNLEIIGWRVSSRPFQRTWSKILGFLSVADFAGVPRKQPVVHVRCWGETLAVHGQVVS